jgi:hypothetical protein
MTELPSALAPWETELRLFAPDVARSLSDLVPRIDAALGARPSASQDANGEPDGYDGLTKRGPYTRLLASEWLLATELPHEFLRRATMGEHSFLALARSAGRVGRCITALFDAGPSQLGAPRIGQLALLVVLARRARCARAELRWGVIQRAEVFVGLDAASVRALLSSRTAAPPSAADLARWDAALPKGREEQWLVGGRALAEHRGSAALITLEDVDDPSAARIALRRTRKGSTTEIALDLPSSDACVRLLRDPFAQARAPLVTGPGSFVGARILFSSDGRRLLVRLASGPLLAYPVPSSPRASPGKHARFLPFDEHHVVSTDWRRGHWCVVTQSGPLLRVSIVGKRGGNARPPRSCFASSNFLAPFDSSAPLAPLVERMDGALTFVHPSGAVDIVHTLYRRSQAIAVARYRESRIGIFADEKGEPFVGHLDPAGKPLRHPHSLPLPRSGCAMRLGFALHEANPELGLLAVRARDGRWIVHTKSASIFVTEPPGFTCIAPAEGGALIGFTGEKRQLVLVGPSGTKVIADAAARIVDACASSMKAHIAYVTEAGEVVVRDRLLGHVLLRLSGEGSP